MLPDAQEELQSTAQQVVVFDTELPDFQDDTSV